MLPPEDEVLTARHAFPDAQAELSGVPVAYSGQPFSLGWHGTRVEEDRGSFCLVNEGGLEDLIGEILLLRYQRRSVWVYCVGATDLDYDLSISRRAFGALSHLATESLSVLIEVRQ